MCKRKNVVHLIKIPPFARIYKGKWFDEFMYCFLFNTVYYNSVFYDSIKRQTGKCREKTDRQTIKNL